LALTVKERRAFSTMRLLIVSWYFPPANDVAALRIGKLAEFMAGRGHDVWVLTGARSHPDPSLLISIAPERIVRTSWFDVQQLRFHGTRAKTPNVRATGTGRLTRKSNRLKDAINAAYMHSVQIPDRQIGWVPYLNRAGRTLLARETFDLIYASGPPFSAFVAARSLSRQSRVPWVAEYRDGWSRYVYNPKPRWREALDERLENAVTPTASAIVTVSEPWAEYYRSRFGLPTAAIYNGFDAENLLPVTVRTPAPAEALDIAYLGVLYNGLRDPSILYIALKRSGLSPKDVRVSYYGPKPADVYPLAEHFGVSEFVSVHQPVSYQKSLRIQRESDVLLLLQSPDDPRNVPAKVFEYLASCRPILGLGLDGGIPAKLIRERGAGLYVTDPDAVAAQLKRWVAEKKNKGILHDLPASTYAGLSRSEQFLRLDDFLSSVENGITARSTP
jgi:glycosyltransferase involved in cell wall biosynthesis